MCIRDSDASVRNHFCQLMLFFCQTLEEFDEINQFLDAFINLLSADVGKSWMKFNEYFQFWCNFAMTGSKQIAYPYSKDIIAQFIDFFLEKQSPIQIINTKKVSMGNNYTQPQFDYLLKTVTYLIRLGVINNNQLNSPLLQLSSSVPEEYSVVIEDNPFNKCYRFTKNTEVCLTSPQFYKKVLRSNSNILQLSLIVRHMSYNNEPFSRMISIVLLNNFQKVTLDDAKSYLQLLYHFLLIKDSFQKNRIEWVLGYPQRVIHSVDLYQITEQLDQGQIDYLSTLNQLENQAFLSLIFNKRKTYETICMLALAKLLEIIDESDEVFEYIHSLPPPNYLYSSYFDWMPDFFIYFQQEYEKFAVASYYQEKAELKKQTEEKYALVLRKIDYKLQQFKQIQILPNYYPASSFSDQTLPCPYPFYIIGLSQKSKISSTEILHSSITNEPEIVLQKVIEKVYFVQSQPTGKTNLAFPKEVFLDGVRFSLRKLDYQQSLSLFLDGFGYVRDNYSDAQTQWKFFKQKRKNQAVNFNKEEEKKNEENHEECIEQESNSDQQMREQLCKDYLILKYIILNKSMNTINVRLKLTAPETQSTYLNNLNLPHSFIERQIQGNQNSTMLILTKIIPNIEFPKFDVQTEIDFLVNDCRMQEEIGQNSGQGGQWTQPLPMLKHCPQNYEHSSLQKQCPACQLFVESNHAFCEHCYYDFQ
eukprot:TRINITY_DN845_c0_g1_i6.p1 TRINITY_DN845_c0_g1~~TRINITY_DN845_c0_g1_i6.p1  ORF type:complete len:701 (-),score=51.22 TRINITY_DN845_c0_g1_i6:185-2287(-)